MAQEWVWGLDLQMDWDWAWARARARARAREENVVRLAYFKENIIYLMY